MLQAFITGLLATSSLIIGGILAIRYSLSNRAIGVIMGFGAGTLISAISYELIFEAVNLEEVLCIRLLAFLQARQYFISLTNLLPILELIIP
jgi:zinc transporter ZupT